MASEFRRVGLANVEIDKQGNVLGWRPGEVRDTFVLAAHLDISFAEGVNTKVRKEGPRWFGPGLGDDSRAVQSKTHKLRSGSKQRARRFSSPVYNARRAREPSCFFQKTCPAGKEH